MKNAILFMTMLFLSVNLFSQTFSEKNDRKFSVGFNVGVNHSNLQPNIGLPDEILIVNDIGINVGLLMDYAINKHLMLSPKAAIAFYNSRLEFVNINQPNDVLEILPVTFNFMTHLTYKFKSSKIVPYVFAGPNVKIPISKKMDIGTGTVNDNIFALDLGIGLEKFLPHFIFAPELKYSFEIPGSKKNFGLPLLAFHTMSLVFNFK